MVTKKRNVNKKHDFLCEDVKISETKLSLFRKNGNNLNNRELAISIIFSDNPINELEKLRVKNCIPKMSIRFWENVIQFQVTGELPEHLMELNMNYLTNRKTGIIFIDENLIEQFSKIENLVNFLNNTSIETMEGLINLEFPAI